jgi:hypothetical protein
VIEGSNFHNEIFFFFIIIYFIMYILHKIFRFKGFQSGNEQLLLYFLIKEISLDDQTKFQTTVVILEVI